MCLKFNGVLFFLGVLCRICPLKQIVGHINLYKIILNGCHSRLHSYKNCYWETPGNCRKSECVFVHCVNVVAVESAFTCRYSVSALPPTIELKL